jgi:hypothetical protein
MLMNSCVNAIGTTSPSEAIGFLLALWIGWDFAAWLLLGVPWPAPLTIVAFWKCFDFAPMAQRTRAHFCTAPLRVPGDLSVIEALVLISWPLSPVRRFWQLVGRKAIQLWGVTGTVPLVEGGEQINRWRIRCTGSRSSHD